MSSEERRTTDSTTPVVRLERIDHNPVDTVAAKVARQLIDHILMSDELTQGQRLPSERDLSDLFGVGRSAVREALKALSFIGLVEIRPGSGTFVQSPDAVLLPQVFEWGLLLGEQRIGDLIEIRRMLEVGIAGLAADRRDEAALERLRGCVDVMRDASSDKFVDADMSFHLTLAESTGNPILSDILSSIQSLLRVWISRVVTTRGVEDMVEQHRRVLKAIEAQDSAAAEEAMKSHMNSAMDRLISSLPDSEWINRKRTM